ncbi:TATA box-binding protein-associated factor RNA polymerase I subunit A-like [Ptychodera flava]|uniref:TATA box-binding protein-associated factor RNA polymerase I subunit A-like n=1 Tax=Ptychodera flava TaxID=63121 RepID=UPI00396A6F06
MSGDEDTMPEDEERADSVSSYVDVTDSSAFFSKSEVTHNSSDYEASSKALHAILRECLLNHRWKEANLVLESLCLDTATTADIIWKCGLEVFYNHPKTTVGMVELFYGKMKKLNTHYQVQKTVEHAMYLLSRGQVEEAHRTIKEGHEFGKGIDEHERQAETKWKDMATLYSGLIEYFIWAENKRIQPSELEEHTQADNMETDNILSHDSEISDSYARSALQHFEVITETPGIWDVFVTRHVELLGFYKKHDEAQVVLERYRNLNPDNPNAHKYLYHFLKEQDAHPNELIPVLKSFLSLVPSDALAMDMCEIIQTTDADQALTLPFLFDLLDYGSWQNDLRPWVMLADQLTTVHKYPTKEGFEILHSCWDHRSAWWPSYHFRDSAVKFTPEIDSQLLESKAIVASFLLKSGHTFITAVQEKLNEGELQAKLEYSKKLRKKASKIIKKNS